MTGPRICTTRAELSEALRPARVAEQTIGLVPTMGALHRGHASLMAVARERAEVVVTSIFVNPTQFAPGEDLDRYPRTFDADVAMSAEHGVDFVFAPSVDEMYPGGDPAVTVAPGPLGAELEGIARPTHFAGVLTVVAKLFGLTRPDLAVFGEKDYQQLTLIRQMVADLCLAIEVVGAPTVREADGLALSSRNRYLSPDQRQAATALSRALRAGAAAGDHGPEAVLAAAHAELAGIDLDYLELRAPDLRPVPAAGEARLLIAARVGETRLIDNLGLVLGSLRE